jgi:NodT family efflux transporter outer membrane factor (OMF) lipoprotein
VRRSVEAADAQSAAAVESRNDALVSLEAEVAQTYLQLRGAQALRGITVKLLADAGDILELTRNRQVSGLSSQSDVEAASAELSSIDAQLPQYEFIISQSSHALAVLAGQLPDSLNAQLGNPASMPPVPAVIPIGVPASLARRRPDIRLAEANLHAATADIGVSIAGLYPDISLTGQYGLRNTSGSYLFDWASRFYSFGPGISLPIFKGGALVANVTLSREQAATAAIAYRKTVLTALQEVEDALSALHDDARKSASLGNSAAANERALALATSSYRSGLVSFITVLDSERQTGETRQQLAQALLLENTDLVKLYKALGGGWENPGNH